MLKIGLIGGGLVITHVRVDKEHIGEPESLFVVPVHVLKHTPPCRPFEVAVEGEIIGQNRSAGIPHARGLFAKQSFNTIIVIGAAIVKVAAAVLIKDRWL